MDLLTEVGDIFKVSLDRSVRRGDSPAKWRYYQILGLHGEIYPYSETHLAVAFYHSWRTTIDAQGDVIWHPSIRSPRASRFLKSTGREAEVLQECDELTCFKVPNRYLHRALKHIHPVRKQHAAIPHLRNEHPEPKATQEAA